MAKSAKTKKKSEKKVWTKDRKELVSVEKFRESTKRVMAKGIEGGREYYGLPLKNK